MPFDLRTVSPAHNYVVADRRSDTLPSVERAAYKNGADRAGDDSRARLSCFSAACFALAVVLNVYAATLLAALGLVLLSLSFGSRSMAAARFLSRTRLAAAVVAVALIAALIPDPLNASSWNLLAAVVPCLVIAFAVADMTAGWTRRRLIVAAAAIVAAGLVTGILLIQAVSDVGIDVVQLHRQAAVALARGENPYGPAVAVPNGSPGAPAGSTIVGYPYQPVAAVAYASSAWLGDPRWASLASWVVTAACALVLFREPDFVLPFLLLAAIPGATMMLQTGWTEMLSAALIAVAAVTWRRPIVSGLALGAALGSKQYFVVALPLIALYRDAGWQRRTATALTVAAVSVLAAFAWSVDDAWRALVLFHAQTGPRSDSSNLAGVLNLLGVHWTPPLWLGLGVSWALVAMLARRAPDSAGFWRAMAAALAAFFMLSSQAMPNYWYLVAVVAVFGSQTDDFTYGSSAGL
jgi:hypothetical protein